ncbi:MAG: PspA/IM30 family protein [Streptosporangiales bacterium]|nr:PspA/IM30 family protein [Streptosporangiales bacterium]
MSVLKRFTMIFRAKANKAMDKAEDPRETLDYSYQKQLELLQKVRRGVADVATSRKRLELQMNQINQSSEKLANQAKQAMSQGREDLAREALTRRSGVQQQFTDLQQQHAQLQGEEEKLTLASQRLQAKVDSFRTRKETVKATYSAAEAQTKINEAFSGISEEMGDVGMAIQRAEDKTSEMQARAGALDELIESGAIEDVSSTGRQDDIQRELDQLGSDSQVEHEMQQLRNEITAGEATKELDAAQPAPEQAEAAQEAPQQQARPGESA